MTSVDLLTVGTCRRHAAPQQPLWIDVCCPRPTSAANQPAAAAAVDRRDGQTDGRTPDSFIDLLRITPAVSIG